MFKWLKKKATQAAANQCKTNIRLGTKTLISIANTADEHIIKSGGATDDNDIRRVAKAQESLFKDIVLGHSNGLSLEDIRETVINPILEKLKAGDGARLAIEHVIKEAAQALGIQLVSGTPGFSTKMKTMFFQGDVKIDSFDNETTKFRVVENGALLSVRNDTHLRLVEDIMKIPFMPYFEIVAPMTAVEVLEGELPANCLIEHSLDHYLKLRMHYVGE
jgi:hypothetical protein